MADLTKKEVCFITKKIYPINQMIRFVISDSNTLAPDLFYKLEGKEIFVKSSKNELETFSNGLDEKCVKIINRDNIVNVIDNILLKNIIGIISMARKSRKVIIGYNQLKTLLDINKIELLFQAMDGSEKRKNHLKTSFHQTKKISCLSKKELGVAFGKKSITNIGFVKSNFISPLISVASRLQSLRNN